ncbi:MAG: response regulator [Mariprofundaceae bacterium]
MLKTILTIDDNESVHEVLEPMLEIWLEENGLDMAIVKLCDGAEALEWVKANGKPYMVLLDVRMPVMDGAEFLRQVAILGYDFRRFTLLLTGYADDLEQHLGTDALLIKHLRKPFMAPEFLTALDELYNRAKDSNN